MQSEQQSGVIQRVIATDYFQTLIALIVFGLSIEIFARPANGFVLYILTHYGLISGSLWSNMWIGGVTEPITSKLLPATLVGVFGSEDSLIFMFVSILSGVLFLSLFRDALSVISVENGFLVVILILLAIILWEGRTREEIEFNPLIRKHAYIFGLLAGSFVGILELYYYVNMGLEPLWKRIPPVVLHSFTGTIIVGSIVDVTRRDLKTNQRAIFVSIAVVSAIAVHVWWNMWLVDYTEFWTAWKALYDQHLHWLR